MSTHFELDGPEAVAVSVSVRPALLSEQTRSKIGTLRHLEEAGKIDQLTVNAWPGKVPVSHGGVQTDVYRTFERFEEWAEANGVSIRPPFEVETTASEIRERSRSVLRTPGVCLALSVENRLSGVFPHTESGTEYSVTEAIAALRADRLEWEGSFRALVATATETTCPECEGRLVNVQGVDLCHDCGWHSVGEGGDRTGPGPALVRPTK